MSYFTDHDIWLCHTGNVEKRKGKPEESEGGAMTYKETSKVCCMRGIWSAVAGFEDEGRGP